MPPKKPVGENKNQIGNLFEKYKRILKPPQASVEKEAIEVIKKITGFELKPTQVSYKTTTKTLKLQIPSVLLSEIRPMFPQVLEALKNNLGESSPQTIL